MNIKLPLAEVERWADVVTIGFKGLKQPTC